MFRIGAIVSPYIIKLGDLCGLPWLPMAIFAAGALVRQDVHKCRPRFYFPIEICAIRWPLSIFFSLSPFFSRFELYCTHFLSFSDLNKNFLYFMVIINNCAVHFLFWNFLIFFHILLHLYFIKFSLHLLF